MGEYEIFVVNTNPNKKILSKLLHLIVFNHELKIGATTSQILEQIVYLD